MLRSEIIAGSKCGKDGKNNKKFLIQIEKSLLISIHIGPKDAETGCIVIGQDHLEAEKIIRVRFKGAADLAVQFRWDVRAGQVLHAH